LEIWNRRVTGRNLDWGPPSRLRRFCETAFADPGVRCARQASLLLLEDGLIDNKDR